MQSMEIEPENLGPKGMVTHCSICETPIHGDSAVVTKEGFLICYHCAMLPSLNPNQADERMITPLGTRSTQWNMARYVSILLFIYVLVMCGVIFFPASLM